jgi:PAS domain S-box-containing protein
VQGSLTVADTHHRSEAPQLVAALRIVAEAVAEASERLEAQAALRESERQFRRLFDMTQVPLVHVRQGGTVHKYNRRFVEVFGYTQRDLSTVEDWWRLAYPEPDYRDWVKCTWEAAVARAELAGTEVEPDEYRIVCKDGGTRIMTVSAMVSEGDVLATFIDITERKQAEVELERYHHRLEELAE